MREVLRSAIAEAFLEADIAIRSNDYLTAYYWLERAHILTQRMPLVHAKSHWIMLQVGFLTKDWREAFGQVYRFFAALLFSKFWVPTGNTGRARVIAFTSMSLSPELRELLREEDA